MAKQYPADQDIIFLVCDTIRKEPNNKLSLLGLFLGNEIIVEVDAPVTLSPFALLFHLSDGYGEFKTKIQVLKENGDQVLEVKIGDTTKKNDAGSTIGLSIQSLKFDEFGSYTFRLILDDHEYDRQILIRKGQLQTFS